MITVRETRQTDIGFLTAMLAEAASWDRPVGAPPPPPDEILSEPQVADYVESWGREGDAGIVAEWDGKAWKWEKVPGVIWVNGRPAEAGK